jgi:hypothetical protein
MTTGTTTAAAGGLGSVGDTDAADGDVGEVDPVVSGEVFGVVDGVLDQSGNGAVVPRAGEDDPVGPPERLDQPLLVGRPIQHGRVVVR